MIIVNLPGDMNYPPHPFIGNKFDPTNCIKLGGVITNTPTIQYYTYNSNKAIVGVVNDIVVLVITLVPFTLPDIVKHSLKKTAYQIFRGYVYAPYRRKGYMSAALEQFVLTNPNACILSEEVQTLPTVSLWKKLATLTTTKINVLANGVLTETTPPPPELPAVLVYNGTNIPDATIWKIAPDIDESNTLLILHS